MSFEDELRKVFIEEVTQLIQDAEQCFLILEENPNDADIVDKIFRVAHNIKGGAKAIGFDDLGIFSHEFESFLLKVKNREIAPTPNVINLMLKCNDQIKLMVDGIKLDANSRFDNSAIINELKSFTEGAGGGTSTYVSAPIISEVSQPIKKQKAPEAPVPQPVAEAPAPPVHEPVQATEPPQEEMGAVVHELKPIPKKEAPKPSPTSSIVIDESIRVSLKRLEKLLNYIGEMVILQSVLDEQSLGHNPLLLRKTAQEMNKITKEVQDIAMSLRMIPLKQTFQKMQRIARDTANYLGKRVQLNIQGEETEVDKTVLENLSDPLVHLVRNAIDHGIESPEERIKNGKIDSGKVTFRAFHQGGKLIIEIADDGGGINPDKIIAHAVKKGVIPEGTQLSRKEAINLIFHPGFSSKAEVTEISGRGVGMDVVKSNIERMSGEVQVETETGKGTTFKIILPLTLAIIEGMVVVSGNARFVVPLAHISESLKITANDIKQTTGLGDILLLRGENVPLFYLSKLMGTKKTQEKETTGIAIVVRNDSHVFAVAVDDIISQQQIVIKKLGNELQFVKGFSGSSILGDGRPALILELADLINQYQRKGLGQKTDLRRVSA